MTSEMLLASKYLYIINERMMVRSSFEISGEPCAGKLASTVRRGTVGNTGYAVRWPPTRLVLGLVTNQAVFQFGFDPLGVNAKQKAADEIKWQAKH